MGKALKVIGIMILVLGVAIFALPVVLPTPSDGAEFASRTSTVGGGFIGVGLFLTVIGFFKATKG